MLGPLSFSCSHSQKAFTQYKVVSAQSPACPIARHQIPVFPVGVAWAYMPWRPQLHSSSCYWPAHTSLTILQTPGCRTECPSHRKRVERSSVWKMRQMRTSTVRHRYWQADCLHKPDPFKSLYDSVLWWFFQPSNQLSLSVFLPLCPSLNIL